MKRASKRLVTSIIALVASVILCIGVCLAWFAMNSEVSGEGMQTQVKSGDIVDFRVTAYYLDYNSSNNNYSVVEGNSSLIKDMYGDEITIDHNEDKIINSFTSTTDGISTTQKDVMRPYSLTGEYTTAVLFKVDYEIAAGSAKNFRIFAECSDTSEISRLKVNKVSDNNYQSGLSNTISFVTATQSATPSGNSTFAEGTDTTPNHTYAAGTGNVAFVNGLREKSFHVGLNNAFSISSLTEAGAGRTNASGNYENTEFFIMDYEKERFTYISSLLLESGGGLNSGLTLVGDISLGIEEYDSEEVVTPTSIAVDTLAYNYSTAYTQPMGANIMTPNWQFVVTYSDGSKKIIVGTNSNLAITDLDTNTVGNSGKATATYTEKSGSVECKVPYTIGLVITGGTGVAKDDTIKLSASGLGDTTITWSSSNTDIAIVSDTGEVTGKAAGTVTITATAADYVDDKTTPYLKAKYEVTVTGEKVAVEKVTLNTQSLELEVGDSAIIVATITPENATNKALTWTSSSTSVTVDQNGRVTVASATNDTVTITVTAADYVDDNKTPNLKATCTVTVTTNIPVEKVTITGDTVVGVGSSINLSATVEPANATNNTVVWSTIDGTGTASIDSDGKLTGDSAGTVTVVAEAGGVRANHAVTIKGVHLDKTNVALIVGGNTTITATLYPTTNATITWSTSDSTVATVTGGTINAIKKGTATITAKATIDGVEYSATCAVNVAAVMYTYTFYDSDGTTIIKQETIEAGATIVAPTPTKSGYRFENWYSDKELNNRVESFGAISADVQYYAKWTAKDSFTVTFDRNGHGDLINPQSVYDGELASEPDEPTALGFAFGGWYTDAACSDGKEFSFSTPITGAITLYAKWTEDSYTPNGIYTLDIENKGATPGIFSWTQATGGFKTATDGTKMFKITSDKTAGYDYLYINLKLRKDKVITINATARTSNTTDTSANVTVGVALTNDSNGVVSGLDSTFSVTQPEGQKNIKLQGTVTTEGIIVIQLSRSSGSTGCELTAFSVTISDPAGATATPSSIALKSGTTTFKKGSTASTSDWTFTVTYSNSTTKTVTASDVKIGTIDTSASGSVSVSYTENGTTVNTTVNYTIQAPTAIRFKSGTTSFTQNVAASTADWKFTVTYGSLGDEEVTVSAVTIGEISTTTVGENKTVTVTLTGTELTCQVTYSVKAAVTGVADGVYTFSSSNSTTNKNAGFTISGNYTNASLTYMGETYTNGLKIESSTSIKFTLGSEKKVRLVTDGKSEGIKIDGTRNTTDSNGLLTINLAEGEHTITKGDTMNLFLIIIGYEAVNVESVTITGDNVVTAGKTITLTATVLPANAENKTVTWAVSDNSIATITTDGVLKGLKQGSVTVTATAGSVTSKDFGVTVNAATLEKLTHSGTTTYTVSTTAVTPDWVFTATYSDGSTKTVTPTLTGNINDDGTISITSAGEYSVTSSYTENGKTVSCNVSYTVSAASGGGTTKIYSGNTATDFTDGTTLTVTGTFDSRKDGTYTYNNVTYSESIRAGGSGRYLTIQLQAGQKVTVLFGGNDNSDNSTASMWFADKDGNEISGTKKTTQNAGKVASGLISYTSVNGGTYRIVCDNNKPCIYAVIIESPAS